MKPANMRLGPFRRMHQHVAQVFQVDAVRQVAHDPETGAHAAVDENEPGPSAGVRQQRRHMVDDGHAVFLGDGLVDRILEGT